MKLSKSGQKAINITQACVYLLYKAKKLFLCPSICLHFFWLSESLLSVHGLTSNLLETKYLSPGMTKFIFRSFKLPSNQHRRAIKITHF